MTSVSNLSMTGSQYHFLDNKGWLHWSPVLFSKSFWKGWLNRSPAYANVWLKWWISIKRGDSRRSMSVGELPAESSLVQSVPWAVCKRLGELVGNLCQCRHSSTRRGRVTATGFWIMQSLDICKHSWMTLVANLSLTTNLKHFPITRTCKKSFSIPFYC